MYAAFDINAISKALKEVEVFIIKMLAERGLTPVSKPQWVAIPGNEEQGKFTQRFEAVAADLSEFEELEAWARWTAEECNAILEKHGFSIRLEPWADDGCHFGVVAIYDLSIIWLVKGATNTEKDGSGDNYELSNGKPAFRLPADKAQIAFYKLVDGRTIVSIPGKREGDRLCLVKTDKEVRDFELLETVEAYRRQIAGTDLFEGETAAEYCHDYGGLIAPNIVFDTGEDGWSIEWLVGLAIRIKLGDDIPDEVWEVAQAKAQAKFAMGPKGARARVAVSVGMRMTAVWEPKPDYVVDHDVVLWMERASISTGPLFVVCVIMDDYADHTVGLEEID
jgi:hypothetical protein